MVCRLRAALRDEFEKCVKARKRGTRLISHGCPFRRRSCVDVEEPRNGWIAPMRNPPERTVARKQCRSRNYRQELAAKGDLYETSQITGSIPMGIRSLALRL
jgi:hypothetical protein